MQANYVIIGAAKLIQALHIGMQSVLSDTLHVHCEI